MKKMLKKLTLFDKLIIVLVIGIIAFFAYFLMRKPKYIEAVIKIDSDITRYTYLGTPGWFEQYFYKGMQEKNGLGQVMSEVESVYSYDIFPGKKAVYIKAKLNAVYNRASGQYTYKGRPLIAGSTIKINLEHAYIDGLVTYVEGIEDKRRKVNLDMQLQVKDINNAFPETEGVDNALADAINVGDKVKDNNGGTILEIKSKSARPAKKLVPTADGRVVVAENPLRQDVILTVKATAYKLGNKYYLFDDVPINIGSSISFQTERYSAFPEVVNFTEE